MNIFNLKVGVNNEIRLPQDIDELVSGGYYKIISINRPPRWTTIGWNAGEVVKYKKTYSSSDGGGQFELLGYKYEGHMTLNYWCGTHPDFQDEPPLNVVLAPIYNYKETEDK